MPQFEYGKDYPFAAFITNLGKKSKVDPLTGLFNKFEFEDDVRRRMETMQSARISLMVLGIASIFVCLMLVCNSVLQAHGFINLPVVIMALGGVVKIVTNYNLVAVPTIGISGAPVGNVLCFGLCMVLDLVVIARVIHGRPDYLPLLAKPAAAAGVMGLGAWAVYGLLSKLLSYEEVTQAGETIQTLGKTGNGIAVMGAILIAVIIYAVLVVALRAISREDLSLMPKGDKIAKILRL